jgi:hypothetical protein
VVVLLAQVAARGRRADTLRHLYRAERLLQAQPLADVDLATALRIAAMGCEAAGWPALAMRAWRLVQAQAEGLGDRDRSADVRAAVGRLGLTGILPPAAALVIRHRAGEADDRAFQDALRELTEAARSGGAAEADYVELMREAAAAALVIDRPDRARQLWRLTAIVLRQLDRDDEARELERQLKGR